MGSRPIEKCQNCGAQQPLVTEDHTICSYCGSVLTERVKEAPAVVDEPKVEEPAAAPIPEQNPNEQLFEDQDKFLRNGCGAFVLILIVIIIIAIAKHNSAKRNEGPSSIDSIFPEPHKTNEDERPAWVDSIDAEIEIAHGELPPGGYSILRGLVSVKVDVDTFTKLYKKARKRNNSIYDATNTRSEDKEVIDVSIYDGVDPELFVMISTPVDKWLSAFQIQYNVDGRRYEYYAHFKKERKNGKNREFNEHKIENDQIENWLAIARAKSASITLNGGPKTKVIKITPEQQAAIMRQLIILKGLVLRFDEP